MRPSESIILLIHLLNPLSLLSLKSSRSEEPTNAPENELELGDIIKEIIITIIPIENNT
jgi:hypothetical protein